MCNTSKAEYQRRLSGLQARMSERDIDVFLVSARDSIFYLTGIVCEPLERPFFLLVGRDGPAVFLVPVLEREHLRAAANVSRIEFYREYPAPPGQGWADRLHEMLTGVRAIGVEPSLRVEIADKLHEHAPRTEAFVEGLRLVKSPAEIELIRRAASYADLGIERLLAASYYGASVAGGFAETRTVAKRIIRNSSDFNPLLTKILMGTWAAPRSAQPHSVPKLNDRLLEGPHVALVLTTVDGYAAECERTYFTSPPSPEVKRAFQAMMDARRIAFERLRPSVSCSEVDAAVNDFLSREGFADHLLHRAGHGIGIAYHAEAPWLAEGSEEVLTPGMVVSVEPGIYLARIGGLRHSDTVLITAGGHECLTKRPTDLNSLTITARKPLVRLKHRYLHRSLRCG